MLNDQNSKKNAKNECMEVETESEFQDENEDGIEDFFESETRVKEESMSESDEEEFVRLDKHEAQKLINGPDYITDKDLETFDDNENADIIGDQLKTSHDLEIKDNNKEPKTFGGINYENVTEIETSDNETFDGMDEELESYGNHVEKTLTFNDENSCNVREVDMSDINIAVYAEELKFFNDLEYKDNVEKAGPFDDCNYKITEEQNNTIVVDSNLEDTIETRSESNQNIESKSYVIHKPNCPLCEKKFTGGNWRWNIKTHMKSIHKNISDIITPVEEDFKSTTMETSDIAKNQTVQILPSLLNQDNSITLGSPHVLHNSITIGSEGHRHFCFYCGRQVTVIFRHLLHWHKEEKEMIQIFQMSNKTEKDRAKEALKRHGDHLNNLKTLKDGKGVLIVARTQKNNQDPRVYIPCPNCLVWVSKHNLSMHRKKCHCSIDNFQGDIQELRNRSQALMSLPAKTPRVGFTKYSTCIIATYFEKYVTSKTMPKIEAVQAFLNDQPDESELKEYSVNQIKQKVRNMGKRKSNKINDCRSRPIRNVDRN
jgi:hypothetical protein